MAMPQRDDLIGMLQQTDLLLEYAVRHGETEEAERLRAKLRRLAAMGDHPARCNDAAAPPDCRPVWDGRN